MKNHILLYSILLLFFLAEHSSAQTQQLDFEQIKEVNGVPIGKINAITQDQYGFLWLSDETNRCVSRFDGNTVKQYINNPNDTNSLGGFYPECLFVDPGGVIWIGFYGHGLDRFDYLNNTFTHYDHDVNDPESLGNDHVTSILRDSYGNLWIGTYDGLDLLDESTGKFKHFSYDYNDVSSLSSDSVRVIYEDSERTLWVGTGIPWAQKHRGGLNRFNRETGQFTRYLAEPDNPDALNDNNINSIYEDREGTLWIGAAGNGLHSLDRESGLFTRHLYDPEYPEKLSRPAPTSDMDVITFISEDIAGQLWIGTGAGGINRYDPKTKRTTFYGGTTRFSWITNSPWSFFSSDDGLIWISIQPDFFKVDPFTNEIPHFDGPIPIIFNESENLRWKVTDKGLLRENLESETTQIFQHNSLDPKSISSDVVNKIFKDSNDRIWIGTSKGLDLYDEKTQRFSRYFPQSDDSSQLRNNIYDIIEDSFSNLWFISENNGLVKIEDSSGEFNIQRNQSVNREFLGGFLPFMVESDGGVVWAANFDANAGLHKVDIKSGALTQYLSGATVNCIYKDEYGVIWVGTQNGLFHYNIQFDYFEIFDLGEFIFSVMGDENNNIWVSSQSGLSRISASRDHLIKYWDEEQIFQDDGNDMEGRIQGYKNSEGELYLRDLLGYYHFNPDKLRISQDSSRLYFNELEIGVVDQKPGNDQGVPLTVLFEDDHIELDHSQNTFSISFTEIDFRDDGNGKIFYSLENYDNDWRVTQSDEKVTYYKIPPGEYKLRMKASNSANGIWSEKSMLISIAPPWWQTWWAYGIYGIIFVVGVFIIDRIQRKRLIEKERSRTQQKELEQAREIEKSYTELKTTQSQLIHSEKMASLGELTAGIAHEIQNPLNFVNNFSDVNKELADELLQEIRQGNVEEAESIAKDIISNEEKITHHGQRADGIVKGMLQHSRAGGGEKEPTDINELADEYLRLAYHGLRAKDKSFNADFKTELDPDLPKVNVVPQDIGRVLLNLINNAFFAVSQKSEAGSEGYQPTVTVSTKHVPLGSLPAGHAGGIKGEERIEIKVSDNGQGIPEQVRDKIFQPFFTTKATGEGTGLGLSLSYDIVKGHGGELKVDSEEGKGTEFLIILPV